MTGRVGIVAGLASIAALTAAGPAAARDDVVRCSFEADLTYSQAVTSSYGDSSFSSEAGALNCAGRVGGQIALGVGSVALAATAGTAPPPAGGESCATGSGHGTIAMRVPKLLALFDPDPYTQLAGEFDYRHVATVWEGLGWVSGTGPNANIVISGYERAHDGGCITGPKTASTLSGEILVGGEAQGSAAAAGAPCSNHVSGTRKADRLRGTADDDMLSGFGGGDQMRGKAGPDCLFGGRGSDRLRGGPGADAIHCGRGIDTVIVGRSDSVARNCEKVRRG